MVTVCPFCGSEDFGEGASDAYCVDCGNSWLVEDAELYDDEGRHAVSRDEIDELIDELDALHSDVFDDEDDDYLDFFDDEDEPI